MKNKITILLSFAFFTIFMVSCKVQKERCAAYGNIKDAIDHIRKYNTSIKFVFGGGQNLPLEIKNIADKTQKSI